MMGNITILEGINRANATINFKTHPPRTRFKEA